MRVRVRQHGLDLVRVRVRVRVRLRLRVRVRDRVRVGAKQHGLDLRCAQCEGDLALGPLHVGDVLAEPKG